MAQVEEGKEDIWDSRVLKGWDFGLQPRDT